jgi:hypothetical protein
MGKTVQIQARQEGRGLTAGSLLGVNDQGQTQARRRIAQYFKRFL